MGIDQVVLEGESALKLVPHFLGETGERVGWGTTMDHRPLKPTNPPPDPG